MRTLALRLRKHIRLPLDYFEGHVHLDMLHFPKELRLLQHICILSAAFSGALCKRVSPLSLQFSGLGRFPPVACLGRSRREDQSVDSHRVQGELEYHIYRAVAATYHPDIEVADGHRCADGKPLALCRKAGTSVYPHILLLARRWLIAGR